MTRQYALIDCNSFYASCERLFRPDLKNKPVVVLSNNDGCIVARSAEAKALNINMAVPYFQVKDQLKQHDVAVFSSNYALYADISERVMTVLRNMLSEVEVYSIDEAFAELHGDEADLTQLAHDVRQRIAQWVGIPVCVGIGPTKTLAKLANHAAKKYPATQGVVNLNDVKRQKRLMHLLPVSKVWGIGRRLTKRLNAQGIHTVLQLASSPPSLMRKRYSLMVERTIRELRGQACFGLQEAPDKKQQIICSRSFGTKVTDKQTMQEAVATYTVRAVEKLRQEGSYARIISVEIRTSMHTDKAIVLSRSQVLIEPSSDSREFLKYARKLLNEIWQPGYLYAKAAVVLRDFYQAGAWQPDLFHQNEYPKSHLLMQTVDKINQSKYPEIWFASQGTRRDWRMQRHYLSPAYTTRWNDLPKAQIG